MWDKIDKRKMDNECKIKFKIFVTFFIFVFGIERNTFSFSGLISLGNTAICDAGVYAMEASTSAQHSIPARDPSLVENIAFKPIKSCIVNGVTLSEDWLWMAIHHAVIN